MLFFYSDQKLMYRYRYGKLIEKHFFLYGGIPVRY
jgi:hypothetical protein